MLKSIALRNLLSFGDPGVALTLGRLNVLIGANGSGKSNLLDAIDLLQSTRTSLLGPVMSSGGPSEWRWKGASGNDTPSTLKVSIESSGQLISHTWELASTTIPIIVNEEFSVSRGETDSHTLLSIDSGRVKYFTRSGRAVNIPTYIPGKSALSQLIGHSGLSQLRILSNAYESISLFRDWHFGRGGTGRRRERADQPRERLESDFSNLGLVLNRISLESASKNKLLTELQRLMYGIDDLSFDVNGGSINPFLTEFGRHIPVSRLSDGTLRYLGLLAIFCDPSPPQLVAIEEPELGLHPDVLSGLARLMLDASERMQIIATTHSEVIVDALTYNPEAIIVCEKDEDGTKMDRLPQELLGKWLEKYTLGQLWSRGHLGGNRW